MVMIRKSRERNCLVSWNVPSNNMEQLVDDTWDDLEDGMVLKFDKDDNFYKKECWSTDNLSKFKNKIKISNFV
jgi:hypothetical protein